MANRANLVSPTAGVESELRSPSVSAFPVSPAVAGVVDASPRAPGSADCMAYMSDLLRELAEMAATEGHPTLAGLLTLAHQEAEAKTKTR